MMDHQIDEPPADVTVADVTIADVTVLDAPDRLAAGDPASMLAAVASAGPQVRAASESFDRAGLAAGPVPRALVVVGMGGSAAAGDVLAATAGDGCAIPVLVHRDEELPGWVGPEDLVIGVSCSGGTAETLAAAGAATRCGARLITVGGADSPLAELAAQAGAPHLDVDGGGRQPRANLWSLAVPLLRIADGLGLVGASAQDLDQVATVLDGVAQVCRPTDALEVNRAKQLAVHLAGGLPMIWGAGPVGGAVAARFANQLAENAKVPAICGRLSEPHHNQIVAFGGPFAGAASTGGRVGAGLRLVVVRDESEPPTRERRVAESLLAAQEAGVPAVVLHGAGSDARESLAGLIALVDFASVYLALMLGIDPTPVRPIDELKARLAD